MRDYYIRSQPRLVKGKPPMKNRSESLLGTITLIIAYSLAVSFASLTLSSPALAQSCIPASTSAGSLDSCFGAAGKVIATTNNGTGTNGARAVAIQTDGKIVIAVNADNPSGSGKDFYVSRYNSDGSTDSTFGSGGVARIAMTKTSDEESPQALAIQADGKIIVVGYAAVKGNTYGFAIARLNSNGSLDTLFGSGGKLLFTFQNNVSAVAESVTILANGYIVVAGRSNADFALARLRANGAFDTGFNGTGRVTVSTAISTDTGIGGAYDVTIQNVTVSGVLQEKLVAVGIRPRLAGVDRDMAVLRFNPNGSLDSSFGSGGKVFTNFSGYSDQAKSVVIDANNNIVVAGHTLTDATTDNIRFALVRYTESGQLDPSFGVSGKVTAGVLGYRNFGYGHGLAIQADGRITASSIVESTDFNYADFAVARFNSDGTPDITFGSNGTGIVVTDFYGEKDHAWGGLALQADGRIVVVGSANNFHNIALARYMP
jgi:uncharacterized delta-60 repeat protein